MSGDTQDRTSQLRGEADVRADTEAQRGARAWHGYMTLSPDAESLQLGPCKDTEEMVEFERLGGKDVFKTVSFREHRRTEEAGCT